MKILKYVFAALVLAVGVSAQTPNYPYTTLIVPQVQIPGNCAGKVVAADGTGCVPNGGGGGPFLPISGGIITGSLDIYDMLTVGGGVTPIIVTGTLSPDLTGTYTYIGQLNGYNNYYSASANAYIYSIGSGGYWLIGQTNGDTSGTAWYVSPGTGIPPYTSSWIAAGSASGTLTTAAGTSSSSMIDGSGNVSATTLSVASPRRGTFICTGGGTISVPNANMLATSTVIISLNAQGGTITTSPAMKTVTATTGFTVLCGATDTSTYNYMILN
jgi:hypothetical protein